MRKKGFFYRLWCGIRYGHVGKPLPTYKRWTCKRCGHLIEE